MKKRRTYLLLLVGFALSAVSCCSWSEKHCGDPQPVPGPVIRLGLQGGGGTWTVNGVIQQVLTESTRRLRDDFIGVGTKEMKCTIDGVERDVSWIRLKFAGYSVLISKPTATTADPPHWLVEGRNGATYELLPDANAPSGFIPPELTSPTGIETSADGTNQQCSGLKLQVWRSK